MEIPFRMSFSHGARAERISSDSFVLVVGTRNNEGFGEAVVREYVSGSLGTGDEMRREAARITSSLLAPLKERDLTWRQAAAILAALPCEPQSLPLLCAVESAVLACAVQEQGTDAYAVLQREPARAMVVYGGVLPFVPLETARSMVSLCAQLRLTNLKVKVGRDTSYNREILGLCRQMLGDDFDIRVDANSAWTSADADEQAAICARHRCPGHRAALPRFRAHRAGRADGGPRFFHHGGRGSADRGGRPRAGVVGKRPGCSTSASRKTAD